MDSRTNTFSLSDIVMPKPRSGFAAIFYYGQIIVIGGNDGHVLNKVNILDLKSKTWKSLPSMIMRRDELSVTIGPDNKLYAIGGYGGP